jgi:hypothetical protein
VGVIAGVVVSVSCIVTSSRFVSFCGDIEGDWMATRFFVERDDEEAGTLLGGGIGLGIFNLGKD